MNQLSGELKNRWGTVHSKSLSPECKVCVAKFSKTIDEAKKSAPIRISYPPYSPTTENEKNVGYYLKKVCAWEEWFKEQFGDFS